MSEQIKEILLDKETVEKKIKLIAWQISQDYLGKELVLVCILKGAVFFLSELMKNISIPVVIDFVQAGSYGKQKISSGEIAFKKDIEADIRGKHVLIVEDIVDTGTTMDFILKMFKERGPKSIKVCALLDKVSRRQVEVPIDYRGFEVPDRFIVGYGLDFDEKYRNLPYIAALD